MSTIEDSEAGDRPGEPAGSGGGLASSGAPAPAETAGSVRRLPPDLVAKISAGEMILRPVSAAKELLENAIDAGARHVSLEVRETADRYLSVSDDGCGMTPDEVRLAIERHATSKLERESDLLTVQTLGFRGEALPSIGRIARLTIVTSADGTTGTEVRVYGGDCEAIRPAPRGRGTTVTVEDLFFNTPVRKRFLRSPVGEIRLIQRLMSSYALACPEIDFRLVVDAREVARYVAAEPVERLEQVYGPGFRNKVLPLRGEHPRVRVGGWIGIPEMARATAQGQTVLVHGRWVSHPPLAHALRQGYGDRIPANRQPFAVLLLDPRAGTVDVNVHPTKREIRFLEEGLVYAEVARAVREATRRLIPAIGGTEEGWRTVARVEPEDAADAGQARGGGGGSAMLPLPGLIYGPEGRTAEDRWRVRDADGSTADEDRPGGVARLDSGASQPAAASIPLWQVQDRYIVGHTRQGILIVDQHAAHERILYEKALVWLSGEQPTRQALLFPVTVRLEPGEALLLEEILAELHRLGLDVQPFGGDEVILRAVPASWQGDPASMLHDLLEDLRDRTRRREERTSALAASFACHSAIRSGQKLDLASMNRLIDELFATSLPHGDPHGRPTYMILSAEELDRRFGRTGG
ncbi:MAG: DNA mismatch repair endonuclease MutL [Candidatus Eisenbacteria bacterium]|nr:DNA mismatch repair endonuclease MutL [Candidatus Eisenbacteria bacterium]